MQVENTNYNRERFLTGNAYTIGKTGLVVNCGRHFQTSWTLLTSAQCSLGILKHGPIFVAGAPKLTSNVSSNVECYWKAIYLTCRRLGLHITEKKLYDRTVRCNLKRVGNLMSTCQVLRLVFGVL